ncbi:allophanate hydrolase subunit 1 [Nocardia cyriacigeorgica]|uniref:Allophanate hydrolase subunit 1 n=1 Tax=Nocardia cyriacigeorgica TaxID=135487 RepID=A0A6P1D9B9_9NOCA|nr:allophanate hydrolase subunit 1 [Nocardia cyriacigeorgica]NEW38395.1 allophanate hydrolase subunit 1 [Nocardia cyriacigeorgica]NEW46698.1 allophanate hydrolase subunit 1 [Nocardia cyriacigeorgica]NEW49423.1 allophanate hydrolase subunit 1 [Nocardia cyriacigeorgica]NEW54173.1 allophanate hydrolase subunit 1 [Nocardia cyriacigeorgica]
MTTSTGPAPHGAQSGTDTGVIRAAGDRAFLIIPHPVAAVTELAATLRHRPVDGVQDVLPAAETVLVTLRSSRDAERVRKALHTVVAEVAEHTDSGDVSRGTFPESDPVLIPVHYDGTDLADVARTLELTVDEVIAAHTGTVWRCAFVGFAPGFGYLCSPDERLAVPRRAEARTTIPAGSVALAGGYSAVYPRKSPGGWQLIGHTEVDMWDVDREPPAVIRAGTAVRFVNVQEG